MRLRRRKSERERKKIRKKWLSAIGTKSKFYVVMEQGIDIVFQ